ncbi:protein ImpG/VasA [Klebsiella pneumoniae]|uniref:Protein ImpG/VasA n=1 Tax=Klebsiella pneumoniae TaxID=573 RepID=A0A4P0Y4T5_KLEPN|nr:protein ImpG/VasA [Klebsiella pneumoniae]
MLNLDKAGARDPFVERLFEGFAFLMGRMREKLDDDLPELTEGVVSLLWPHYLRTIPSMSVVEFTPDWPEMKEPMTMAKGFEVLSRPIGEKGHALPVHHHQSDRSAAVILERVQLATDTDGRSVITLRFTCSQLTDWRRVDLSHIPLYCQRRCAAGLRHARGLYPQCGPDVAAHADEVDRRPLDGYFSALGFGEDDGLWPEDGRSFRGYQLLLEYLPSAKSSCSSICAGWRRWLFRPDWRGLKSTSCWRTLGT